MTIKITPKTTPYRRRTSAVSHLLSAVHSSTEPPEVKKFENQSEDFNFQIATKAKTRRRAYELAYRVYNESGYLENDSGLCISPYDEGQHVFTILVRNKEGKDIGTATLIFDCDLGLPSDEIYPDELNEMRLPGKRIVEVTRLAIDHDYRGSRLLLMRMFNFLYIHACHSMNQTGIVIEVNPRHVDYYKRIFGFSVIGDEKPCPRVLGAPSVLLYLSLEEGQRILNEYRSDPGSCKIERLRFIRYFYGIEDESKIRAFISGKKSRWNDRERNMYRGILRKIA